LLRVTGGTHLRLHHRASIPRAARRRSLLVRELRLALHLHPRAADGAAPLQAVPHPLRQRRRAGDGAGVRHGPAGSQHQPPRALQVRPPAADRFDQVEGRLLPGAAGGRRLGAAEADHRSVRAASLAGKMITVKERKKVRAV
jgi:hypothetical protein